MLVLRKTWLSLIGCLHRAPEGKPSTSQTESECRQLLFGRDERELLFREKLETDHLPYKVSVKERDFFNGRLQVFNHSVIKSIAASD